MCVSLIMSFVCYLVLLQIEELRATLSNKEYQIITECAQSNISETPNLVPLVKHDSVTSPNVVELPVSQELVIGSASQKSESWITIKVLVAMDLVELRLRSGLGNAPLATLQVKLRQWNSFVRVSKLELHDMPSN